MTRVSGAKLAPTMIHDQSVCKFCANTLFYKYHRTFLHHRQHHSVYVSRLFAAASSSDQAVI